MKFNVKTFDAGNITSDLLILVTHRDTHHTYNCLPDKVNTDINTIIRQMNLSGDEKDLFISLNNATIPYLLLITVNQHNSNNLEDFREAGFYINKYLEKVKGKKAHCIINLSSQNPEDVASAITEGLLLSAYSFSEFKSDAKKKSKTDRHLTYLFKTSEYRSTIREHIKKIQIIAAGVNYARTLANRPGNVLTPLALAKDVRSLFRDEPSIDVEVLQGQKLESLKMNAFLAVAKGSDQSPALIIIKYKSGLKKAKKLALIGKGITFDSGGISIKPAGKMEEMKYDMAGSAAVIGVLKAISVLRPKLDIVAAIPAAENLPSGKAYKPGDIIKAFNATTVEIINTDAEGRLLLADTLSFVEKKYRPDWMVDLATLTGSIVSTFGDQCCGMFSKDDRLLKYFHQAADKCNERVWAMPMWDEYKKPLESKVADIKHVGGRDAGSITAAKFLETFVTKTPWVHLDIAGTAYDLKSKKYLEEGASGFGVRLVLAFIENLQN
jgi:leucyl aminopeptidase